ncbi:type II toxin-antitoxin system RelE/ParE family toxin [Rhizobium sp. RAF56]|uniref:type II toxin-antitoxin system RelE/ParE family toxin n=1 Tax=Rhizobium sp. RAF56 TaxID=3233062 RepID=UPI003F9B5146
MKTLIFSPRAADDIDRIFDYTAEKWGSQQAEDYTLGIRDICRTLLDGERRGRKIAGLGSAYLALSFQSHFIIYKATERNLTIVRILHRQMNIATHL